MPEELLGFSAVVAGIVIRHALGNPAFVQGDSAGFEVIDQQVEDGEGTIAIEELRNHFANPYRVAR